MSPSLDNWSTNPEAPYTCPDCGKSVAKPGTPRGSAQGLLSMHVKHKHPEKWSGRTS